MIPFANQRGLGQDLATHLMNEQDNEYMEVAQVRGAIAQDLHGAFAEWEAQAHALTRCKNYLYSLSVNPWEDGYGRLTREQYFAYIDAVEERLGLVGQARAVVFHIKNEREHAHVVWSRIDADEGKARHLAFDHDKLMMVTRQFAREHGLRLPEGYEAHHEKKRAQLSLYEQHQQNETGISREERMAQVTAAWRQSDSARAFVRALEEQGYILASDKRPYVLVDLHGHMNSLPKLIDDRQVRTNEVRAFLEKEFPSAELPRVDEARKLAADHRKAIDDFEKASIKTAQLQRLKVRQAERRSKLEAEGDALKKQHARARHGLAERHSTERSRARSAYLEQAKRIRLQRAQRRPKGLAAFLGRVTGVELVTKKLHRYQDRKRHEAFLAQKQALQLRQEQQRQSLQQRQHMQAMDMQRKLRALDQIDKRERKSLEASQRRAQRIKSRSGSERAPSVTLELRPPGRKPAIYKAKHRYTSSLARELTEAVKARHEERKKIELTKEFERASGEGRSEGDSGDDRAKAPKARTKESRKGRNPDRPKRPRNSGRKKGPDLDRGR